MKNCLRKRVVTLCLCILLVFCSMQSAYAATPIGGNPSIAQIEYEYSETVECGTVRYICQNSGNKDFFNSKYWGSKWKNQATSECLTVCISMALSYVGVNKTPKDILDLGYAKTGKDQTLLDEWAPAKLLYPSIKDGMNNYINGNGKYSPVIVHFKRGSYSTDGHYVCLVGKDSSGNYLVCDPWKTNIWKLSTSDSLYKAIDCTYQYYNKSASIVRASSNNSKEEMIPDYMSKCTEYLCCGWITMSKNATVKSYPCSVATFKYSEDVGTAKKGQTYQVTRVYKNSAGNYWYKVEYNGRTGYVYGGDCTHSAHGRYHRYYYTPDGKSLKYVN